MPKHLFLIILSLACFGYALHSINELVFKDHSPFSIKCLGVLIDPTKTYEISNRTQRSPGTLQLDYPQGKGLLPNQLATIAMDKNSGRVVLTMSESVSDEVENSTSPFSPFARPTRKEWIGGYKLLKANEQVDETLLRDGIIFNSPSGDKTSRVTVKVLTFGDKKFVSTSTEGIGIEYQLEADKSNRISVICNGKLSATETKIFRFDKSTDTECKYTIDVTPNAGYLSPKAKYNVFDKDGTVLERGDETSARFQVGDYLFELSPRFDTLNRIIPIIGLFFLAAFQLWYLTQYKPAGSPPVQSFLAVKILLNCLVFLSVPLYWISLSMTNQRMLYWGSVIVLNVVCSMPPAILHRTDWLFKMLDRRLIKILVMSLLLILPLLVQHFSSNEKFLKVPVLHWQKIAILGVILMSQYLFGMSSWNIRTLVKFILILLYAAALSFLSSDLGSFLYCLAALLIIGYLSVPVHKKYLLSGLSALLLVIAFALYLSPGLVGAVANGKGYRLLAPYTSPDSSLISNANEADRETYANLNLIQKHLLGGDISPMNELAVPVSMRSTAFSDFAFFWSLALGKWVFGPLVFLVVAYLIYQLTFLLILTIRPIQIGKGMAYMLPASRESEFIQFLLALAIVSFTYPILSNLLLIPLTGQSLPCISISLIEPLVLVLLVLPIGSVFTNPLYVKPAESRINESYRSVLTKLKMEGLVILVLFSILLLFRLWFVHGIPDDYGWNKSENQHSDRQSVLVDKTDPTDVDSLTKSAKELIGSDQRIAVGMKKKATLRDLTSLYFTKQPFDRIRIENAKFELTSIGLIRRMNLMSQIATRSKQISGESGPFGKVTAFDHLVNGKFEVVYSNPYYSSIPANAMTINHDLTAELAKGLADHLAKIGISSNRGAVLVIDNSTGGIVANSSFPLESESNTNQIHYFAGSLKKTILAYSALQIDRRYKDRLFNGMSFSAFLKKSDDKYAALLLKDLMLKHEVEFGTVLDGDFSLPIVSETRDAYFDRKPAKALYTRELDELNEIYRYSIGQEKPYRFIDVVQWYSRIAAGKKIELNYTGARGTFDPLSIESESLSILDAALEGVLSGTANNVGDALESNGLRRTDFFAKTGTAESETGKYNTSSSIIVANKKYTIGIMLNGQIPHNTKRLAAKDLMVVMIPVLKKNRIL